MNYKSHTPDGLTSTSEVVFAHEHTKVRTTIKMCCIHVFKEFKQYFNTSSHM